MPSQLNPPRVPCVQETARRLEYQDETTGAHFTPTGQPITVVDSICEVGFTGPFNPPTLGVLTIIGPDECEVGNSAQYRAVMAGKNVEDETYAWTLNSFTPTPDTGSATLSNPTNTDTVEVNFTGAGNVTVEVTVTSATAGNSPLTASKEVTVS
jgi:hypothetical protein